MRAIFSSAAERDVKRALDFYKREAGAKIANDFVNELKLKVVTIRRNPRSFRVVTDGLRCVNLDRFPYQIVYRIANETDIQITTVRHHKQNPDFGLDR